MGARCGFRRSAGLIWPTLIAVVVLLVFLLGGYTMLESRRMEQYLTRELEQRAASLAGILEASSRNAIASQAAAERVLAQRLLDNARFIDFIIGRSPRGEELIGQIVAENQLAKVEFLDLEGNPLALGSLVPAGPGAGGAGHGMRMGRGPDTGAALGPGAMMHGRGRPHDPAPTATPDSGPVTPMPFMWGMRWGGAQGDPSRLFPSLPKHAAVRQFWAGSAFGVAVPAQSFNGVIVVHAEAEALVALRQQVGPQALIQALAKEPGIAQIALLDSQLTVLASTDGGQIGKTETDSFLNAVLQVGTADSRRQGCGAGCETVEIVRPLTLESGRAGLLRVGFNTAGVTHVTSQARRGMLLYSVGLLAVGIVASATIFWLQARHLAERQRFEAVVEREGRLSALGNLAAGVAHQIRNPLNAISIGLQRLRMEFSPAAAAARDEYLEFTRVIEAEVRRLNEILERFLALARPLRLALEPEPLTPILEHVATLIVPQAAAQHVRVDTACPLGDRRVAVDRQQLGHALMNIVQNGLQAMPQGGVLTIRAGAVNSREAEVTITDTGPGIPNDLLDRIFEPYFTTKEGGTGLGLALAHRIVVEHGGSVQAVNGDAGGARFVIRLPLLMG